MSVEVIQVFRSPDAAVVVKHTKAGNWTVMICDRTFRRFKTRPEAIDYAKQTLARRTSNLILEAKW